MTAVPSFGERTSDDQRDPRKRQRFEYRDSVADAGEHPRQMHDPEPRKDHQSSHQPGEHRGAPEEKSEATGDQRHTREPRAVSAARRRRDGRYGETALGISPRDTAGDVTHGSDYAGRSASWIHRAISERENAERILRAVDRKVGPCLPRPNRRSPSKTIRSAAGLKSGAPHAASLASADRASCTSDWCGGAGLSYRQRNR